MNILHLMKDYKPSPGGSVVRNSNMIEAYKRLYETDNIYIVNLEGGKYERHSWEKNILVYRTTTLWELVKTGVKLVNQKDIDVIQAHNFRFLFSAFLIHLLARKKPEIFVEIHAIYHMSRLKEAVSFALLKWVRGITVLAQCAKDYLVENHGIDPDIIHVIRNGAANLQPSLPVPVNCRIADQLEAWKKRYRIAVYYGSFFEWQGVNFLGNHFDYLLDNEKDVFLLLLGDGPEYETIKRLSEKARFKDRILVHCNIPKEEILHVLEYADIVLIPRIKNISTDTAIPLKAIEAMEMGKCILASNDNGLLEILNQENAEIFDGGDIRSFLSHLQILVHDGEHRDKLGKRAKKDGEHLLLSWEENSRRMHRLYEQKW